MTKQIHMFSNIYSTLFIFLVFLSIEIAQMATTMQINELG